MKKQEKIKNLEKEIDRKKSQLNKLGHHVDKSTLCSDLYNRVVLEKAILYKELQDIESDNFVSGIKKLLPRRKTLICDYFRGK